MQRHTQHVRQRPEVTYISKAAIFTLMYAFPFLLLAQGASIAAKTALDDQPQLINSDPSGDGWIFGDHRR